MEDEHVVLKLVWVGAALTAVATLSLLPEPGYGQPDTPAPLAELLQCRKLAEASARLACFDAKVAALDIATQKKEIAIVDAAQVRRVHRSLFGFALPKLNLLGGSPNGDDPEKEIDEIQATVKYASQRADGNWVIVLDDGAQWTQIDGAQLKFDAKPGDAIRIKKAALGSYFARINNQTAIRMQRINR